MASTSGKFGYPVITNDDPMEGPDQITAAAGFWDGLIAEGVTSVGDLPDPTATPDYVRIWVASEKRIYVNTDSVWVPALASTIGITAASVSQTLTTSPVTLSGLSLTVVTPAVPVRIRATVQLNNAGSGADRTASLQLLEDTTALGLARVFTVPLVGSGSMVAAVLIQKRTPSAGSHTYTVKASASINTAVTLGDCDIDVTVIP